MPFDHCARPALLALRFDVPIPKGVSNIKAQPANKSRHVPKIKHPATKIGPPIQNSTQSLEWAPHHDEGSSARMPQQSKWAWLGESKNQKTLSWIGGTIVAISAASWGAYEKLRQPDPPLAPVAAIAPSNPVEPVKPANAAGETQPCQVAKIHNVDGKGNAVIDQAIKPANQGNQEQPCQRAEVNDVTGDAVASIRQSQ